MAAHTRYPHADRLSLHTAPHISSRYGAATGIGMEPARSRGVQRTGQEQGAKAPPCHQALDHGGMWKAIQPMFNA
jgi:hypothetical protein